MKTFPSITPIEVHIKNLLGSRRALPFGCIQTWIGLWAYALFYEVMVIHHGLYRSRRALGREINNSDYIVGDRGATQPPRMRFETALASENPSSSPPHRYSVLIGYRRVPFPYCSI